MPPHPHRTRRYWLPACALILLLVSFEQAYAQEFTLANSNVALRTGRSTTVKVSSTVALAAADVNFTASPDGFLTITKSQETPQSVLLTLTARQQAGDVTVNVTVGATTQPLKVSILPFINTAEELSAHLPNLPDPLTLKRNEQKTIPVATGVSMQSGDLVLTSTDEKVVTAAFDGQNLRIIAVGPGPEQVVTISNAAKVSLKPIRVTVKEAPESTTINLTDMTLPTANVGVDWTTLIRLRGLNGQDVTDEMKAEITPESTQPDVLSVNPDDKTLRALKKGTALLRLRAAGGKVFGPVVVTVKATPDKLSFSINTGSPILRPNQNVQVTATIKNMVGDVADDARVARWEYFDDATTDNQSRLRITFSEVPGTNTISVTALPGAQPGLAKLKAFFGLNGASEEVVTFTIQTVNVTDFKPLQIRFDILDEQTARDLFGKKAADDFHITKIRLFNKLRDNTNVGNSILVYGESLEVNVALEIREKAGDWRKLEATEYEKLFGTKDGTAPDLTNPSALIPCSSRTRQPNFIGRYRPMTFEMVANTHDRRDERGLRSRILLVLNSASSMASFITSIAVPGPSSDLPLGLDKFRNLLIPSFEKLYPDMREVQRQNILSMAMRSLEEVPFGSDITRIVFFPKKPIRGVIPDTQIRIGAISISDACAEVAIIKKNNQP